MPSFSSLDRLKICSAAESFPRVDTPRGEAATNGTIIHSFAEGLADKKLLDALLVDVPEELHDRCRNINFQDRIFSRFQTYEPEAGFALHLKSGTSRYLGRGRDSMKYRKPDELGGIVDLWGRLVNGALCVLDYKTGRNIGPIKESMQMRACALAVARANNETSIVTCVAYIDVAGELDVKQVLFTERELNAIEIELFDLMEKYYKAELMVKQGLIPSTTVGDHCGWCKSKYTCPAQTSLIRGALGDMERIKAQMAVLTPIQLGQAWIKVNMIEDLVECVKNAIKVAVQDQPIPTTDGKALQMKHGEKYSFFSNKDAIKLLKKKGATDEEISKLTVVGQKKPYVREMKLKGGY